MRDNGFSLIELLIVMTIGGFLMAMATLQFNSWTKKSGIESQINMIYSDLMTVKSEAVFRKQPRLVTLTATQLTIYPKAVSTDPPLQQKTIKHPLSADSLTQIIFDTSGMTSSDGGICIAPIGNVGAFDSIAVSSGSRIQMGKWTGGGCSSANIASK